MGVHGGPDIVTDGLVFCWDVADKNCYPGSGTTGTDLIGGLTGTLTNNAAFSTNGAGSIALDGTADYVAFGNNAPPLLNLTLEGWAAADDWDDSSRHRDIIDSWSSGDNADWYRISITSGTGYLSFYIDAGDDEGGHDNSPLTSNINSSWVDGTWHHIVGVRDTVGDTLSLYADGVLVASDSHTNNTTISPGNLNIGDISGENESWDGHIATAKIYNRALSAKEVLQNFNANKSRFGI